MDKRLLDRHGLTPDIPLIADFYHAVGRGNPHKLREVWEQGFPVNYQDPLTGEAALHRLAGGGGRPALRVLTARDDVNYLLLDNQGRLASELAYRYGRDPALARLIGIKERKQADAEGVRIVRSSGRTEFVMK